MFKHIKCRDQIKRRLVPELRRRPVAKHGFVAIRACGLDHLRDKFNAADPMPRRTAPVQELAVAKTYFKHMAWACRESGALALYHEGIVVPLVICSFCGGGSFPVLPVCVATIERVRPVLGRLH